MFSHEIDEIFKNTFFYRTPLVAASEIKKVFNFQGFLLWLAFFWIMWLYKWSKFHSLQMEIGKKHSPAKYVICATEFCRMEIRLKASLLLWCRTHLFFSPRRCFYSPSYVCLFVLFPCYPATKWMAWKHVLLFSLNWKRRLELNTLDF